MQTQILRTEFHPKFFDVFSDEELEEIYAKAWCGGGWTCCWIFTKKYFFELSADMSDGLELWYEDKEEDKDGLLTKNEFLNRLRESPSVELECISVEA